MPQTKTKKTRTAPKKQKKSPVRLRAEKRAREILTAAARPAQYEIVALTESKPLRLNLGAGTDEHGNLKDIPGFTHVDRKFGTEVYPLAYPDACAEEVRASHILEHFGQNQVLKVLEEWTRVLKPGGILRVAVPDMGAVFAAYAAKENVPILSFTYGGQLDENDYHKCGFDEQLLKNLLMECGLEDIRRWESEAEDCAKNLGRYSLNLMGRKPAAPIKEMHNVGGILAAPRLSYTMHSFCTQRAMAELTGLQCNIIQGCFWWTQLCEGMDKWLKAGKEYVLTFDYDSVFTSRDIIELYRLLQLNPDADAVCALQCKRGGNEVLFSMPGGGEQKVSMDTFAYPMTQIGTGHFGLTMFRASSLDSLPRPWMTPVPGKDGSWNEGDGKVDPDINFWHRWRDAGKKLFLANHVPIGHLEEKVKWPSKTGEPIYQGIQEYTTQGKPAGVWI